MKTYNESESMIKHLVRREKTKDTNITKDKPDKFSGHHENELARLKNLFVKRQEEETSKQL